MSVVASFIAGISSGALCVYAIQDSVSIRRSNQGDRLEYAILGAKARPVRVFFLILYESREKNDRNIQQQQRSERYAGDTIRTFAGPSWNRFVLSFHQSVSSTFFSTPIPKSTSTPSSSSSQS